MRIYTVSAIALAAVLGSILPAQPVEAGAAQLRNWAAPLYWQSSPEEVERHADKHGARNAKAASAGGNAAATAGTPAAFVAITPCRLVDTRPDQQFSSPWGPPALAAYTQRNFDIPADSKCGIPPTAVAYSLNFTVVPLEPLDFNQFAFAEAGYVEFLDVLVLGMPAGERGIDFLRRKVGQIGGEGVHQWPGHADVAE